MIGSISHAADVRALVDRPKDTSKKSERKCKVDSDCVLLMCRSYCGFDGVANKKSASAVMKRCNAEKKAAGEDTITVDCAPSRIVQTPKCIKKWCTMIEDVRGGAELELGPPSASD